MSDVGWRKTLTDAIAQLSQVWLTEEDVRWTEDCAQHLVRLARERGVAGVRGREECLGGHATHVHAGATERARFDGDHARPLESGVDRRGHRRGRRHPVLT